MRFPLKMKKDGNKSHETQNKFPYWDIVHNGEISNFALLEWQLHASFSKNLI
jgi:hypothetical protein